MSDPKDKAQSELEKISLSPGDRFQHYKTKGTYEIVTLALKEDTLEPLVVYKGLKEGTTWVRTYENFSEKVELSDRQVLRFMPLER